MDPDNPTGLSASILEEVDRICVAFEQAWCQQKRPCLRQFLDRGNEETRSALLHELLLLDIYYRTGCGEQPRIAEYVSDFPQETSAIEAAFDAVPSDTVDGRKKQATQSTQFILPQDQPMPSRLGRYRIDERIGMGGCGAVYRAYDEQLQRFVAIKIPHRDRFANTLAKEMFLKEARLLATLSHSGIVPVHDVGFTEDSTCFIVSQFIDGGNLAEYVATDQISAEQAARIVLRIAEALHSAHAKGFVHRDVKLSNILRDTEGNLYIADFGLALSEEDMGTGAAFAGTPTNMSPEQARGEGHLVDGRTDIYGLGVVLYELLTRLRPFDSRDVASLLEQIERREPKPLRQINDQIPKELERICLKCLSKRPSDRYSTAMDLADDLRNWELHRTGGDKVADSACLVIPKGLRSFDEQDGDFFLQLLPGPHDRDGLPGIIRFWKARVTETIPEKTFRVGVIYGPSGCGKSSLVKAALLPRVAGVSQAIYLPAGADDTESRLYAAIANKLRIKGLNTESPQDNRLVNLIKRVRRDHALSDRALPDCAALPDSLGSPSAPSKLLIVIDQFEQWLHAHADPNGAELVAALRQCDGQHVQCILLVRDDFWMPLTRFMGELEIPLVEHENATAVDLFEREHARKVLVLLGRAHGRLPDKDGQLTAQHVRFLDKAVSTIEEQGRVIPVRLSLMVEMLKARRWEPATLASMGGTQGLGTQFLDHTFHSPSALPAHRYHQQSARRVLQELLPEPGVDLTVHHRSWLELFEASGYDDDPTRFEDLLRILDLEMRLITPIDQTADRGIVDAENEQTIQPPDQSRRRYQLTHDYLVPSIREWLWGKQRETARGRAQICLEERASLWSAKREQRQLPGIFEWLRIRFLTDPRRWTSVQQRMMHAVTRCYLVRAICGLIIVGLLAGVAYEVAGRIRGNALVHTLESASTEEIDPLIDQVRSHGRWVEGYLRSRIQNSAVGPKQKWKLRLASLSDDEHQDAIMQKILIAEPAELNVICAAIKRIADERTQRRFTGVLWQHMDNCRPESKQQLRLACCLAVLDPTNDKWENAARPIVEKLVTEPLWIVSQWLSQLHAVKWALQGPFEDLFVQESSGSDRAVAATALAEFLADKPEQLVELIKLAQPRELAILVDQLQTNRGEAATLVESELLRQDMAVSQDTFESKEGDADADLKGRLERAHGMMTPQFAICLSVPLADLTDLIDTMRTQGYRPIRCRPYVTKPETHVAIVWTKDNLKWKFQTGLSVLDVTNNRAEMQIEGLRPLDIAGYRENGEWRYLAVWVEDRFSKDEVRMQLLVPEDHWQKNYEEHRDAGFQSQTTQIALDEHGIRYRSQIWLRPGPSPVREQRSWLAPEDYRIKSEFPGVPVDLTSYVFESKEIYFGVIWHRDLHVKTKTLQHNSYLEHLKAAHEIARQGYRPAVVSVVQQPLSELPKVVSIWRHLLPAKDVRNRIAASKANLAITLVRLGHIPPVLDYLKHPDHDLANHYFLHRVVESRIAPRQLVDMLKEDLNDQARRSILLAIGQYKYEKLEPSLQSELANHVTSLHNQDASPAIRSATEWLLEKWGVAVDANAPTRRGLEAAPGWFQTPRGQMMLTIPVKRQHSLYQVPANDTRWISVSAREITVDEYMTFRPAHKYSQQVSPDIACPIGSIGRDDALEYCRWLSDQEGVAEDQQCIVPSSSFDDSDPSWTIPPDYVIRTGYRLLDFDEWQAIAHPEAEFAGIRKVDRSLLSHYSRYAENSVGSLQRGGRLLPNQFGVFDLYGNAAEWIIRRPSDEFDDPDANDVYVIGGCINSTTWQLGDNHAFGQDVPPELVGFRIARTVTPAASDLLAQAKAYARSGELRTARALLEQLSKMQPENPYALMYRSLICTYLGDEAARRDLCGEILRRHSATEDSTVAHEIGCELLLKPDTVKDWSLVKRLAQVAARQNSYPFNRSSACVHVRMGEHERARLLLDDLQKEDHGHGLVITLLFEALNYQGLHQPAESQQCLTEAEELFAELESALQPGDFGESWRARIYCLVLFQEIRARLGSE